MHYFIPKLDHSEKLTIGQPTLLYACKIDKKSPAYTRIIHSHSEAVEFIYILEGNGQFLSITSHIPYIEGILSSIIAMSFTMNLLMVNTYPYCVVQLPV